MGKREKKLAESLVKLNALQVRLVKLQASLNTEAHNIAAELAPLAVGDRMLMDTNPPRGGKQGFRAVVQDVTLVCRDGTWWLRITIRRIDRNGYVLYRYEPEQMYQNPNGSWGVKEWRPVAKG